MNGYVYNDYLDTSYPCTFEEHCNEIGANAEDPFSVSEREKKNSMYWFKSIDSIMVFRDTYALPLEHRLRLANSRREVYI